MQLVCEECRDWPVTKRKVFVNYNNKLRTKREYKQRQARLAGATSDQSVYETDTDVPLDEPSVPVPNVHLDDLNLGQQQCLISEEVVVSAGPSTETTTSDLLLLPPGSSDVKKPVFLCWVEKKTVFFRFFPNFSGIFIISCIICISELPARE